MIRKILILGAGLMLAACATSDCKSQYNQCQDGDCAAQLKACQAATNERIAESEADFRRVEEEKRRAEEFRRKYGEDGGNSLKL